MSISLVDPLPAACLPLNHGRSKSPVLLDKYEPVCALPHSINCVTSPHIGARSRSGEPRDVSKRKQANRHAITHRRNPRQWCLRGGASRHTFRSRARHRAVCSMRIGSSRPRVEETAIEVCGVDAFGVFDTKAQAIRLLSPKTCRKMANANPAYASLPFLKFYESLVVHEVAHQIFRSHLAERSVSLGTHEYVAYAFQIASLPSDLRQTFLKPLNTKPLDDLSPFVDLVLLMSPEIFGALAYAHYSKPGNGCRVLREIIEA